MKSKHLIPFYILGECSFPVEYVKTGAVAGVGTWVVQTEFALDRWGDVFIFQNGTHVFIYDREIDA